MADEANPDGVSERRANHDVDVVDGLDPEWSIGGGAVVDQVCVEAIEMSARSELTTSGPTVGTM